MTVILMNDEVILEIDGKSYTVPYSVDGDELNVYFPDGRPRITMLRGLTVKSAVRPHLISYLKQHPDYS